MESFKAGRLDDAEGNVKEALSLKPSYAQCYILRAKILLERGETGSASEALVAAEKNGADSPEMDYLSGVISQRYERFEDALGWYQRAAAREPLNVLHWVAVAETLVALERPAEALALVQQHRTDFEQNATLRALAGNIHMMLGQYEEGANDYRDAARIAPDDARLQAQLGLALTLTKNYDEGNSVLTRIAEKGEKNGEPVDPSIWGALGRCRLELNQAESAKTALHKAVDADPNNPRNWQLLARASLASSDLLTAREAVGRAVQLEPLNSENVLLLAYIAYSQKDMTAGLAALDRILRDNPNDLMALYLLMKCHQSMGNVAAAHEVARRALSIDAQCEWAGAMLSGKALAFGANSPAIIAHPGKSPEESVNVR
jgi:tetratricopeptide (TPR) repeat protein